MSYLARRLIRSLLLLASVSVLCFVFSELAPGSFFDELRLNPQISPETISTLRARYGLDQPLIVRYGRWLRSAAHADLGYSIGYNTPVAPLLWQRAKNTLLLTGVSLLFTWLVSVPLGVWTAARPGRFLDKASGLASSTLISIPEVVIAVALLAVVVHWRILPVGGMSSVGGEAVSRWAKLEEVARRILPPALILVLLESAVIMRHVRASVLETLQRPFVEAARSLGIPYERVLFRHVLPSAASPMISLLGFSLGGLVSGSLLVEVIFGWPGLGPLILDATLSRDLYLVIGGIMLSALFMVGGNLVADVLLVACDPRIRTGALHAR